MTTLEQARACERATLSIKEVGSILTTDPRTLMRAIEAKEIPAFRLGKRVLIPREQFLAMFDRDAWSKEQTS